MPLTIYEEGKWNITGGTKQNGMRGIRVRGRHLQFADWRVYLDLR
ncbi:hypothetical protein [Bacillus sp. OV322]|nr:hypothetical protein [Bacillus sp. OV322]